MSFVIAEPDFVATAAGQLAGIRSSIAAAAQAAATPTTGIAEAAADEISAAISRLFGAFGQEFQAVNSQAAAFHAEFVRLLKSSAAAYFAADLANAEQVLFDGVSGAAPAAPDPLGGLLDGIVGGTGTTGGGLGALGGILGPRGTTTGGLGTLLGGSGGILGPLLFGGTGGLLGPLVGGNGLLTGLVGGGRWRRSSTARVSSSACWLQGSSTAPALRR
ncbi:PE family protein [Mycobacterium camsae]|uniref:PE family protein n=1 Tax=Mycobacterium gordonae TaxID=1778 RepID=UPI0019818758|nr:PE family protein [Mycobacterium gordonae]